jgi:NTE family protein
MAIAKTKQLNLALQGGGAHGAFAWGALDRLLSDDRLEIEGISATSAGASNAIVLAQGMMEGGKEGARKAIEAFWNELSLVGQFLSPVKNMSVTNLLPENFNYDLSYSAFDFITRILSPYQFNVLDINPLRDILEKMIDFSAIQKFTGLKLFISATNVETGKIRVFKNNELTLETILASGCLPFLFKAIEINGEYFWDGGYMGNPAIFPIIYDCESMDVVIIHINPILREGCPTTVSDIMNRINEISFNSSLMREMRAIAFVTHLIDTKVVSPGQLKRIFIHSIRSDELMSDLGVSSKFASDKEFLYLLKKRGYEQADKWLSESFDKVGKDSSVDIKKEFL